MFQESVDRSHGSSKSDLILFLILVAAFFGIGGIVLLLESKINSTIPRYAFIALVLAGVYLIYRYRLIGYRYTVFYEAPKPVYDARFDDMMICAEDLVSMANDNGGNDNISVIWYSYCKPIKIWRLTI